MPSFRLHLEKFHQLNKRIMLLMKVEMKTWTENRAELVTMKISLL